MRILIAEDDRALVMFLTRGMEADGHKVRSANDGAEALEAFRNEMPDLTILDLNLPVLDGEQVLTEMRALDPQLPVLILTGRQEVETRIRCLDLGADDLMVKPFSLHELRARCRALLRRKREARLMLRVGDLEVDRLDHTARRAGEPISLTNKEFALLEHLMLNRGQCISRVDLLDAVWNMEPAQTTNIVDVYVNYLRRKLEDPPPGVLLRTVRGQGYAMRVDPFYVVNLSNALDQTQSNQEQLTEELSSGLRVTTIGSDPVAAAQNVQLLNSIQRDDSFTQTTSLTQGLLQVTDSALGSVVTQLNQALALAGQANNGTLNSSDLKAISNQLAGVRDEVLSLANTNYQGQYVFGGSQSGTTPFTLDNTTTPATVTYNGDSDIDTLQSPTGQSIQLNLPGNQVFTSATANVLGTLNNLIADYASGTAGSGVADTAALNTALNFVSQQRVTIDNSITRLNDASGAATEEATQLTAVQTNLVQADIPSVSTQLSLSQSQQAALIDVIASLGQGSLFDKLEA